MPDPLRIVRRWATTKRPDASQARPVCPPRLGRPTQGGAPAGQGGLACLPTKLEALNHRIMPSTSPRRAWDARDCAPQARMNHRPQPSQDGPQAFREANGPTSPPNQGPKTSTIAEINTTHQTRTHWGHYLPRRRVNQGPPAPYTPLEAQRRHSFLLQTLRLDARATRASCTRWSPAD